MVEKKTKRDRGRILTETGWQKLEEALQQWEVRTDQRRTFEKVAAEADLDPGTVAKIFKRREGADLSKIEQLFRKFQLNVEAIDHCPLPQGIAQSADPNFVGRAGAIADLNALVERGAKVIVIQARGGVGKTTLARKYLQQEFGSFLEFPIAKETKDIASIESLIEEKLKQLGEEPGREFLVSIDRLKRKLQGEAIGILIDNLEPALDSSGKFIEPHRRYVELLRVLSDPSVQSTTLITSRERLYEPSVSVQHYLLNSLDVAAWEQFFQLRQLLSDAASLAALHRAYGGNAKAMEIISSAIQTDTNYAGDVAAYWQANQDDLLIERALEDLVTQQFDRLQQLDQDAYNLLCRMGCYRYQDVPTVPIEGLLCLLWDVSENRHRRVIKVLQDFSLVEFENGEYWLHPVIRSEAIGKLKEGETWGISNQKAAEFWTESIETVESVEQALKVFEAYYHYIDISDFEQAGSVIVKERMNRWVRKNTWADGEPLGRSFFRLGLTQQLILSTEPIIRNISFGYSLSVILNILGDLHWVIGNLGKSIELHEESGRVASHTIDFRPSSKLIDLKLKRLATIGLFNVAISKMDLGEIEKSLDIFETLLNQVRLEKTNVDNVERFGSPFLSWINDELEIDINFCMAFLKSKLGSHREQLISLVKDTHSKINSLSGAWSQGYCLLFLGMAYKNLEMLDTSFELFNRAKLFGEESNYAQVQGKAFLGIAQIYQEQENFSEAVLNHLSAIEVLDKIRAKCDLAEAHYQLGLTYKAMGEIEKSSVSFQEAIRLFTEMEAPKQVDRVRRSMQNNI